MKLHRKFISLVVGVALLGAAAGSSALTLGRAKGAVLLGQALKLVVPVQLESGESLSAQCFEAEVFYGDSRKDPQRVRVTTDVATGALTGNVYVTSLATVDEPVVTVYLRSVCEGKSTRRFVLLADQAKDDVLQPKEPARESDTASLRLSTATVGAAASPTPVSGSANRDGTATVRSSKKPPAAAEAARGESAPLPRLQSSSRAAGNQRPRLKLDLLDLTEVNDPTLKLSNELVLGEENLEKRAQAAALWRSLNASPQDLLNADSRRQALEADLKSLHDVTGKNRQQLQGLSARLETAQSERYANALVYSLMALLILFSVALVLVWRRVPSAGLADAPEWPDEDAGNSRQPADPQDGAAHELAPRREPAVPGAGERGAPPPSPQQRAAAPAKAQTTAFDEALDIDLQLDGAAPASPAGHGQGSAYAAANKASSREAGHTDFAHSMNSSLRAVNTQEMLDVRQQAEFFMTLGQHEEAVTVLKDSIDANTDANPLVYLDLLKVLHTLGRKAEFDEYRRGFNAIFSGHVPGFTEFNKGGSGLEAYPDICNHIVSLWPSEKVVSLIEDCLVRHEIDGNAEGFDLEAFRDLLMLHGVVRRISVALDSGMLPFSAVRATAEAGGRSARDAAATFKPSDNTQPFMATMDYTASAKVDLDLSEPPRIERPDNLIDFDTTDLLPSTPARPK